MSPSSTGRNSLRHEEGHGGGESLVAESRSSSWHYSWERCRDTREGHTLGKQVQHAYPIMRLHQNIREHPSLPSSNTVLPGIRQKQRASAAERAEKTNSLGALQWWPEGIWGAAIEKPSLAKEPVTPLPPI